MIYVTKWKTFTMKSKKELMEKAKIGIVMTILFIKRD
jgi:hypothetical protein